jgi:hypothetical protein
LTSYDRRRENPQRPIAGLDVITIEGAKDVAATIQSLTAAAAIAVGAVWSYFKFVKDRIYRPRLDVSFQADPTALANDSALLITLAVKNIGTSKVGLLQRGTGLRVSVADPTVDAFTEPVFRSCGVHEVLREHAWIESSETVRHDLLVPLPRDATPVLLEARLVCKMRRTNIAVHARRIVVPTIAKSVKGDELGAPDTAPSAAGGPGRVTALGGSEGSVSSYQRRSNEGGGGAGVRGRE